MNYIYYIYYTFNKTLYLLNCHRIVSCVCLPGEWLEPGPPCKSQSSLSLCYRQTSSWIWGGMLLRGTVMLRSFQLFCLQQQQRTIRVQSLIMPPPGPPDPHHSSSYVGPGKRWAEAHTHAPTCNAYTRMQCVHTHPHPQDRKARQRTDSVACE